MITTKEKTLFRFKTPRQLRKPLWKAPGLLFFLKVLPIMPKMNKIQYKLTQ
jgi:hypothetical protein